MNDSQHDTPDDVPANVVDHAPDGAQGGGSGEMPGDRVAGAATSGGSGSGHGASGATASDGMTGGAAPASEAGTRAPTSGSNTELEIKLILPAAEVDALLASPLLRDGLLEPPRTQALVTTYYDTPERHLLGEGMALRLRAKGGATRGRARKLVQTLKTRSDGTAFGRGEWEWPVAGTLPDLALLAETPAAALLPPDAVLAPVFRSEVERVSHRLSLNGAVVELAVDRGRLVAGKRVEAICEVELELESGAPAALFRLAAALHAAFPATRLGGESKAERGWRLALERPAKHSKAGDPSLPEEISASAGFRAVIGSGLRHLVANLPAVLDGEMEGIHQARVAIRRLRAALRLFRPVLPREAEAGFERELRRLGQVLGATRDWDVFCTETLPAAATAHEGAHWIALLRSPAEREHTAAHAVLAAELAGPATTSLVLGLAGWAEDGAVVAAGRADPGTPLRRIAPDLIEPLERTALRRGKRIRHRSIDELHRLRKALKRLRYGVEFLQDLLPEKRSHNFLDGCKALQEDLGALNDAAAAVEMCERLTLAGGHAELAPALAALEGWATTRRDAAVKDLPKAWKRFRKLRAPF